MDPSHLSPVAIAQELATLVQRADSLPATQQAVLAAEFRIQHPNELALLQRIIGTQAQLPQQPPTDRQQELQLH